MIRYEKLGDEFWNIQLINKENWNNEILERRKWLSLANNKKERISLQKKMIILIYQLSINK